MPLSEAETRTRLITPKLMAAGWDVAAQVLEERNFTDGRIMVVGRRAKRRDPKRYDYLLRYTRDLQLAVVEAKPEDELASTGLQQAMEYAQMIGLPFAFSTNGHQIIEHDFLTGVETDLPAFPSPQALYDRWKAARQLTPRQEQALATPLHSGRRIPRYYQLSAINAAVEALARGDDRALLTLATGTGKSFIAFQICWRLWRAGWNRRGGAGRPKILFLADRDVLVGDPMGDEFEPFKDARCRIEGGVASTSREMYFSTYQAIAEDKSRPGLFREYPQDFFDLIVVDECHRGSARANSTWREILDWFTGAAKLGMTATPVRDPVNGPTPAGAEDDTRDTYRYFGKPLVAYSLRQGIDDGFLAPYKVRRVVTDIDATGYRPTAGQIDAEGNTIPDREYSTKEFERKLVIAARTRAIAKYLTEHLRETDRYAKTIVFCVDQEHASAMRSALSKANSDLVKVDPDYVCRVTSIEKEVGKSHLQHFQDPERRTPAILTTSEMLTTGVDAPTVKNIVLVRIVNSMSTFKQIIGRGTRVREDCGKLYFEILDFTGTATRNFADRAFDGDPLVEDEDQLGEGELPGDQDGPPGDDLGGDAHGEAQDGDGEAADDSPDGDDPDDPNAAEGDGDGDPGGDEDGGAATGGDDDEDTYETEPRKFYIDGGEVRVVAETVQILDADGRLRVVSYIEYVGERVRELARSAAGLQARWLAPELRDEVLHELAVRGIDVAELRERSGEPDADPFDLLCHVAFNAPLRTRRERALSARSREPGFWERYPPAARDVLTAILDKYAEYGETSLDLPDALKAPPLSGLGNVLEIAARFGGVPALREAVAELRRHLYALDQAS